MNYNPKDLIATERQLAHTLGLLRTVSGAMDTFKDSVSEYHLVYFMYKDKSIGILNELQDFSNTLLEHTETLNTHYQSMLEEAERNKAEEAKAKFQQQIKDYNAHMLKEAKNAKNNRG